jgi:hypothetical protein
MLGFKVEFSSASITPHCQLISANADMKHLSLSLSILLTAKAAVATPPPGCDSICAAAKKWHACVTGYQGTTLSQTADEFCRGNGFTDAAKDCKLCQNNGYGTGPNHRPGGPPRLARRIDDGCASLCGGPNNKANWGPGCDVLCAKHPSGAHHAPAPAPLARRIDDKCATLCGGPGNKANWGPGCDKICTPTPHAGPNHFPGAPPLVRRQRLPPKNDECAELCGGPDNQANWGPGCAEMCAPHPGGPNRPPRSDVRPSARVPEDGPRRHPLQE